MEPHERALDGLYQARDALNDVLDQMKKVEPAELADSLSCYRVAGVQVLRNYSAYVEDLSYLLEQVPGTSPRMLESAAQLRTIRELLYDLLAKAEDALPTIDQLRDDEMSLRSAHHWSPSVDKAS